MRSKNSFRGLETGHGQSEDHPNSAPKGAAAQCIWREPEQYEEWINEAVHIES